jgi:hypothetical protein
MSVCLSFCRVFPTGVSNLHDRGSWLRNNGTRGSIVGTQCCAKKNTSDHISARITQAAAIKYDLLAQEWPKTEQMTSDHISAKITYVTWREEHLSKVSVLQRVRLSNLEEDYLLGCCAV